MVFLLALLMILIVTPASAREAVDASAPTALSVTMYRDPERRVGSEMDRRWPRGFAMITETRTVTLPPGESTIRFEGVAEGMVAVSAIVTGLPGGTIEKNRNADLLSPGALVDGTLGNRVTITRTNYATGEKVSEPGIVRTRADGGLVLETSQGFEAVRCSGGYEGLTFDHVPAGLSPQPVFSVDTRDASGGTYTIQLTYLAWGFDWQAHYVATLAEPGRGDAIRMRLMSWLTLLNDNGQSFADAELLVVAGKLSIVSDFEDLAEPPRGKPLSLACWPIGSTARGVPIRDLLPPPAPPPPPPMLMERGAANFDSASPMVVVTGSRIAGKAEEEALGDLKLYRVPERVTVAAKGLKQVAFLDQDRVDGRMLYRAPCSPWDEQDEPERAMMLLLTVNDKAHGLGQALPMGGITFFEPSERGDQLVGEQNLRDYAEGQDVELELGESAQVWGQCALPGDVDLDEEPYPWVPVKLTLTNANPQAVKVRVVLGNAVDLRFRGLRGTRVKDGQTIAEVTVPANSKRDFAWQAQRVDAD